MGKTFIEKLLRYTDPEKIYMLMRVKKGKNPKERLVDIFNDPVSIFCVIFNQPKLRVTSQ